MSLQFGGGRKKKIFQIPIPHTYIPNNDSLHKRFTPMDQNLQYSIKCGCSMFCVYKSSLVNRFLVWLLCLFFSMLEK